ncbi:MAG TPA: ABC transporter ATP-binding protein, partial [Micromonospora sp.]
APPPATDPAPAPPPATAPARPGLSLRQVTFRYGAHAEPVLAGLDLDLPYGDHLAVVGASGIGKSTLAALVAGVLRPGHGEVRVDGVPVTSLTPAQLARRRVLIPQEAYVFTGSVRDNLAYLSGDGSDDALGRAVAALGLSPLLHRLGGYDATVRPADLSAGERQLVALARAWLSPAPLVILDEATCHLDPATEAGIERAFADRPGTLVVIAHRVSSALRARRVLLLDGGTAVLDTHDRLLARAPAYRELVGYWTGTPDDLAGSRPDDLPRAGQSQPDC